MEGRTHTVDLHISNVRVNYNQAVHDNGKQVGTSTEIKKGDGNLIVEYGVCKEYTYHQSVYYHDGSPDAFGLPSPYLESLDGSGFVYWRIWRSNCSFGDSRGKNQESTEVRSQLISDNRQCRHITINCSRSKSKSCCIQFATQHCLYSEVSGTAVVFQEVCLNRRSRTDVIHLPNNF